MPLTAACSPFSLPPLKFHSFESAAPARLSPSLPPLVTAICRPLGHSPCVSEIFSSRFTATL